eukprot:1411920-Amphidinium_carterae.1
MTDQIPDCDGAGAAVQSAFKFRMGLCSSDVEAPLHHLAVLGHATLTGRMSAKLEIVSWSRMVRTTRSSRHQWPRQQAAPQCTTSRCNPSLSL